MEHATPTYRQAWDLASGARLMDEPAPKPAPANPTSRVRNPAQLAELQSAAGNRAVQRLLGGTDPATPTTDTYGTDSDAANARGSAEPAPNPEEASEQEGATLTVPEEFVPQESAGPTDRDIHIEVVEDPNDPAKQAEAGESGATGTGEATTTEPTEAPAAPQVSFVDLGRVGTVAYGSEPVSADDRRPHAFTNGGQTGTVVWAGGGGAGARGNQGVGTMQTYVAPTYESRSNGIMSDSEAWIQAGTGRIDVVRSWVGINGGDQGNGHFVTPAAAARINQHEVLHVNSTKGHYDTNIAPLLTRVEQYTARPGGGYSVGAAFTQWGAIDNVKSAVRWEESVSAFQTGDTTDNQPGGTVDTNDVGTGTYPVDRGPGKVAGTDYQHRVTLPSESAPPP